MNLCTAKEWKKCAHAQNIFLTREKRGQRKWRCIWGCGWGRSFLRTFFSFLVLLVNNLGTFEHFPQVTWWMCLSIRVYILNLPEFEVNLFMTCATWRVLHVSESIIFIRPVLFDGPNGKELHLKRCNNDGHCFLPSKNASSYSCHCFFSLSLLISQIDDAYWIIKSKLSSVFTLLATPSDVKRDSSIHLTRTKVYLCHENG